MKVLIGILAGISTSLGVGGGAILILFLTLILDLNQKEAQAINLICFIPASIISIFINLKHKNINLKEILPILFYGIIGSFFGSIFSKKINILLSKKIFGFFIILIAIYEIFNLFKYNNKKKNE